MQDLGSLALPATYVALLSLPLDEAAGFDRAAVQGELACAAQHAGGAPVPSILQSGSTLTGSSNCAMKKRAVLSQREYTNHPVVLVPAT